MVTTITCDAGSIFTGSNVNREICITDNTTITIISDSCRNSALCGTIDDVIEKAKEVE